MSHLPEAQSPVPSPVQSLDSLPHDVWGLIASQLDLSTLLSARAVCKRLWRTVSDEIHSVSIYTSSDDLFQSVLLPFTHLTSLSVSTLNIKMWRIIAQQCPALTHLSMCSVVNGLVLVPMHSVHSLSFGNTTVCYTTIPAWILRCCPDVTSISISATAIIDDYPRVLRSISMHCPAVSDLQIPYHTDCEEALVELLTRPLVSLHLHKGTALSLSREQAMRITDVLILSSPDLKELTIWERNNDDVLLYELVPRLPKLEYLEGSISRKLLVRVLRLCENIRHMPDSYLVTWDSLESLALERPAIDSLRIGGISDRIHSLDILPALFNCFRNLSSLQFGYAVPDSVLLQLSKSEVQLTHVSLHESSVEQIVLACQLLPSLESVYIEAVRPLLDESISDAPVRAKVTKLQVRSCTDSPHRLLSYFPHLETCHFLHAASMADVWQGLCDYCPNLRTLQWIHGCTDESVLQLVISCPRLEVLELSDRSREWGETVQERSMLSDVGLKHIAGHARHLRRLFLSFANISAVGMTALLQSCRHLYDLCLPDCFVSTEGLQAVAKYGDHLRSFAFDVYTIDQCAAVAPILRQCACLRNLKVWDEFLKSKLGIAAMQEVWIQLRADVVIGDPSVRKRSVYEVIPN